MFAVSVKELGFDGVLVPPFEIGEGEVLSLTWPRFAGGQQEQKFLSALRQEFTVSGLTVFVKLASANPYDEFLQKMLVSQVPRIGRLLTAVSPDYRVHFEKHLNDLVCDLPGTMRALLALHVACQESQFVAFSSSGLDVLGEKTLLEYAGEKAKTGWGFLYFIFPTAGFRQVEENAKVTIRELPRP